MMDRKPWDEYDLGSAGVPESAQRAVRMALEEMWKAGYAWCAADKLQAKREAEAEDSDR